MDRRKAIKNIVAGAIATAASGRLLGQHIDLLARTMESSWWRPEDLSPVVIGRIGNEMRFINGEMRLRAVIRCNKPTPLLIKFGKYTESEFKNSIAAQTCTVHNAPMPVKRNKAATFIEG